MTEHKLHNVLVTGGASFIGSNLARYLLATDLEVSIVNLDLLTYAGSLENLENLPEPSRHTFVRGDICDRLLVDRILRERSIDTVINLAAQTHVDRSTVAPAVFVQTNVMGTFTLLEAVCAYWLLSLPSRRRARFHHVSTDEVFGALRPDDPRFTETVPYAPNSSYSATKAASDHLVRAYHHTGGLPTITTYCSNNYGPYQHFEKFASTIMKACLLGKPIPVYGDGSNIRDWLYEGSLPGNRRSFLSRMLRGNP